MLNNFQKVTVIDIDNNNQRMMTVKSPPEIVDSARKTFNSGKTKSLKYRKSLLKGLLKFLRECRDNIIEALYKDIRKHKQEVVVSELLQVENDLVHTIQKFEKWAQPDYPEKRLINLLDGVCIYKDPLGVVLIIGAWNYPILLTLGPLVGALAAGNCIILKPSELSDATSKVLANYLPKYVDNDVVQIYLGGVDMTTALLREKFDHIFFTGSTIVGKIVYEAAAKHLTPVTLELGGKNPIYIDETCDFDKAVKRIFWGKFLNAGQTCISPDYLLCTKEVQEMFLEKAEKILRDFYGNDLVANQDISKIITDRHFIRLVNFIKSSHVALGGKYNKEERIISPTILVGVKEDDPIMQEEIFGPLLPIYNVKSPRGAINFICKRDKPLSLYVFTKKKAIQKLFIDNTSSGSIAINDSVMQITVENLPFGGVGSSGIGAYHGKRGFDTFTHQKSVLMKDFSILSELSVQPRYPPYTDFKTDFSEFAMKKRIDISLGWMKNFIIFLFGIGFTYIFNSFYRK